MAFITPATKDGFAFSNGDFIAEASGRNRHRRATPAELNTLLADGNAQDRPAHWFEAQLIHYGLPPCDTSSDARRALLDALNAGQLQVPAHLARIEAGLKEEWDKKVREETAAAMGQHTDGIDKNNRQAGDDDDDDDDGPPFRTVQRARRSTQVSASRPRKILTSRAA